MGHVRTTRGSASIPLVRQIERDLEILRIERRYGQNMYRVFLDALHYYPLHHYLISNRGGRNRTCDPSDRKPLASEIHPG